LEPTLNAIIRICTVEWYEVCLDVFGVTSPMTKTLTDDDFEEIRSDFMNYVFGEYEAKVPIDVFKMKVIKI